MSDYHQVKRHIKCSMITHSAKKTGKQKEQWDGGFEVTGKWGEVDKIWKRGFEKFEKDSPTPIIKPTPFPPFLVKILHTPITAIFKKSHHPFMKGGGIRAMWICLNLLENNWPWFLNAWWMHSHNMQHSLLSLLRRLVLWIKMAVTLASYVLVFVLAIVIILFWNLRVIYVLWKN